MTDYSLKFPFSDGLVEMHPIDEKEKEQFDKIKVFLGELKQREAQDLEIKIRKVLESTKNKSPEELIVSYRAIQELLRKHPKTNNTIIEYIRALMRKSEEHCARIHKNFLKKYGKFNKDCLVTNTIDEEINELIPNTISEVATVQHSTPTVAVGTTNKKTEKVPVIKDEYMPTIQAWNDYALLERKIAERLYLMQFAREMETDDYKCRSVKIIRRGQRKLLLQFEYTKKEKLDYRKFST